MSNHCFIYPFFYNLPLMKYTSSLYKSVLRCWNSFR
nr:MAG TPA: hypothetical protein [Caudoviricetes sp.]